MQTWSITLHGPSGIISTIDTGESQFVIGTETASDVFTIQGEGIALRHAWVWISEAGLQVEDLGGGTLVNGYQISERVQVEVPASVQVGDVTLIIEVKAVQPVAVSPTPSSLDITIPQRAVTKTKASMEVTIPQRTPTRSSVQKIASKGVSSADSKAANKASPTCEYTLVREIARGGMGQIYFGEDPQLKRNVAVKVSSVSEGGEDPRFSKEAEVLAQLAHPNIVPIYNIGVDAQSRPFYSMKLIKGRTLQAVLNLIRDGDAVAVKDYPRATLLTIFRKVCDAMMFAHSKGILHRDLKPENIMVGEYGEVLVMDWGLAKVLGEQDSTNAGSSRVNDTGDYGMTMEGEVMGTPQYMSPEQAMGMVAELDARSDIYSLGGILYAILTLRPPIEGTTLDEVLTKVKNGSISSMVTKRGGKGAVAVGVPTAMGNEVPEALQAVTLKAMATDRNKRYESVEVFAGDIERYQNGFATQAEDAGALRKLALFVKRHKAFSLSCAALLLFGVFFVIQLRASERVAHLNEKRALEEKEIARRAAAKSQLLLVEAAYDNCDSESMLKGLKNIPEDLRDPDWQYFNQRVDHSDLRVAPEDGKQWTGLRNHPTEPHTFLGLQNDGAMFRIDALTGSKTLLWKISQDGWPSQFSVGNDGTQIGFTVGLSKPKARKEIQIRSLSDGRLIHSVDTKAFVDSAWLQISKTILLAYHNAPPTAHAYSLLEKRVLWKRELQGGEGKQFVISPDEKEILLIGAAGAIEQVDAATGALLSKRELNLGGGSINEPNQSVITPDGKRRFSLVGNKDGPRVRACELSSGRVQFETAAGSPGWSSVGLLPEQGLVASWHGSSPRNNALYFYDWNDGSRSRSIPFFGGVGYGSSRGLFASASTLAINLGRSIRLFQTAITPPHSSISRSSKEGQLYWLAGSEQTFAVKPVTSGTSESVVISLMDPSGALSSSSPNNRASVQGFLKGRPPWFRSYERHQFLVGMGDNRCAVFKLESGGIQLLWGAKAIPNTNGIQGGAATPHPTKDLLWTRANVLQMSTGQIITKMKRDSIQGVDSVPSLWLDNDCVVEIGIQMVKGSDVEDDEFSRSLLLWDTVSGELITTAPAPNCRTICLTPDGSSVIEGTSDKRVRIRDAKTLQEKMSFRAHDNAITSIECHPELPLLITFSSDESVIRIWDSRDYSMREEIRTSGKAERFNVTTDGNKIFVWSQAKVDVYLPESFKR